MKGVAIFIAASSVVACAQIVGIGDFPGAHDAGSDAPIADVANDVAPSACTNAVVTSFAQIDAVSVSSGFVFTQAFTEGVARCAVGSTCADPPSLITVAATDTFGYAAIGASIVYSTTSSSGGGAIHRAALDGTNDVTIFTTPASPSYVAVGSATVTYWVDDDQPAVHCHGCAGTDGVWIDNVAAPSALFADASSVYVARLDASGLTVGIVGCASTAACPNDPRTVIGGLPMDSLTPSNVASDGSQVYTPRGQYSDLVGIDAANAVKVLATGVKVSALAVDVAKGELFYGTSDGAVARVKTDGSTASTTLSTCQDEILSIAFDDTSVYALVLTAASSYAVFSIPR